VDGLWIVCVIRERYPIRPQRRASSYPHIAVENTETFPHACGHSDALGAERVR